MFNLKAFREQSLPTQAQIISQWKENPTDLPVVSVICTAYNQESYIEDALKGFLMQKTDFPFEIIIHDDASTDKTTEIINDYTRKYPLLIKPILQKTNQYSINGHLPFLNTIKGSNSKYLALCEGDDFWIDENKLQKQHNALIRYPKIKLCFTSSFGFKENNVKMTLCNYGKKELIMSTSQVIVGGGGFMSTSSLFLDRDVVRDIPEWFNDAPIGDYYLQIIGSMPEGALYIPLITSCYRLQSLGSWSSQVVDIDSIIRFRARNNKTIKNLSSTYSNYKYTFLYALVKSNLYVFLSFIRRLNFKYAYKYLCFLAFDDSQSSKNKPHEDKV